MGRERLQVASTEVLAEFESVYADEEEVLVVPPSVPMEHLESLMCLRHE